MPHYEPKPGTIYPTFWLGEESTLHVTRHLQLVICCLQPQTAITQKSRSCWDCPWLSCLPLAPSPSHGPLLGELVPLEAPQLVWTPCPGPLPAAPLVVRPVCCSGLVASVAQGERCSIWEGNTTHSCPWLKGRGWTQLSILNFKKVLISELSK